MKISQHLCFYYMNKYLLPVYVGYLMIDVPILTHLFVDGSIPVFVLSLMGKKIA